MSQITNMITANCSRMKEREGGRGGYQIDEHEREGGKQIKNQPIRKIEDQKKEREGGRERERDLHRVI